MSSKQDLQSFLDTLTAGKSVTSGEFQVNPSELLRKFGAILPYSEGWILKILQALCCWGVETLDIKVQRRTLTLRATGVAPDNPLTCATVFEHQKDWRGHYHLFAAVLTLINDKRYERCQFRWVGGSATHCLAFEGTELVQATDAWRQEGRAVDGEFVVTLTKKISSKQAFRFFWRADFGDLSMVLESRAKCFPIPIAMDGRRLGFPRRVDVARAMADGKGLVADEWAEGPAREAGLLGVQVFFDPSVSGLARSAGPGYYLAWVQDGIVAHFHLEAHRLDKLNVVTYLDGRGLPNDLTTLQIRDSEEKRARLESVSQHLSWRARMLDSLRWRLTNALPPDPGRYRGPVRETNFVPAVFQSAQSQKYREEHLKKTRLFQLFKDLEKETIWLAKHGGRFFS